MFKTKFDRWLIEKLVYEYHIFTMQPPQCLPKRYKSVKAPSGSKYPFILKIRNKQHADKCIAILTDNGSVFSTKVHERKRWFNWLINNKDQSFTYRVFWWIVIIIGAFFIGTYLNKFMQTDTWEDFKDDIYKIIEPSL